jgi:hypothetical protein
MGIIATLMLSLLVAFATSARASNPCLLNYPSTSNWTGKWQTTSPAGGSGTWNTAATATETTPGTWKIKAPGTISGFFPGFGSFQGAKGELTGTLKCTGTEGQFTGKWKDELTNEVTVTGKIDPNANGAVEMGAWEGFNSLGPEKGTYEGAYVLTTQSGGSVSGNVEATLPSGTIGSLSTVPVSQLPLLPQGNAAPVGGLSINVNLPTGVTKVKVKVTLPTGSNPTSLFKEVGGQYYAVSPAPTINGNFLEFEL